MSHRPHVLQRKYKARTFREPSEHRPHSFTNETEQGEPQSVFEKGG